MRIWHALRFAAIALATATVAAPPAENADGDGGVSAFYRWTGEVGAPGRMLRWEPLVASLPGAGRASRILYSSTSGIGRGGPIAVSGALYLPAGTPPAGGWPLVSWAHGTTGVADVCAPSWAGRVKRDEAYLGRWLAEGFAVVATDYEGLGTPGMHPYLLWKSEGMGVLDAARAALAAEPGTLRDTVLIVGQSQGSGAALGATSLAPAYAPELKVLGTIATGVVATFDAISSDDLAQPGTYTDPRRMDGAFAMLRIGGTDRALHPGVDAAAFTTPKGRKMLTAARTSCLHDMFALAKSDGIEGANSFARDPAPIDADMDRNFRLPKARMSVPIFVGTGLADSMAGTAGQYNAVKAMCAAGGTVQWHAYPGLTHGGAVNGSLVDSVPFARALLAGRPVAGNCAAIRPPGPIQSGAAGIPFNE